MGNFVFAQYSGDDAGRVLVGILTEGDDLAEQLSELVVSTTSHTERVVGFMPNDEPDEDDEDDEEEEDDGE